MSELPKKDVYIVNQDDKAAKSLMIKLCEQAKPGAVIFVTEEEFECLNGSVVRIASE